MLNQLLKEMQSFASGEKAAVYSSIAKKKIPAFAFVHKYDVDNFDEGPILDRLNYF